MRLMIFRLGESELKDILNMLINLLLGKRV